ncbi:MAG: hypothetical protein ABI723_19215 [Bacteroidia bacterium]
MVSVKTIKTSKFIRWLKSKGLEYQRTKGSHESWNNPKGNNPYSRPIIFRTKDKEIPLPHIKTNLDTMGIDVDDFLKEIEKL